MSMLQIAAIAELVICWFGWILAFVAARERAGKHPKVVRDTSSRWGIVLQAIGFLCIGIMIHPVGFEKSAPSLIASMILGPAAVALAWSSTRHLGKQWRFEAALSADHELIQSGPYRFLRHPIYASMLLLLVSWGTALAWWPMIVAGLAFFLAGIEVRVRAEDRLLRGRFGERFEQYRSRVRAYLPFLR